MNGIEFTWRTPEFRQVKFAISLHRYSGFIQVGPGDAVKISQDRQGTKYRPSRKPHVLWLWGERGFPLTRYPRWLFTSACYKLWDVEWDERWGAWPHCCTQERCWMHLSPETRWCDHDCRWCKFARWLRREGTEVRKHVVGGDIVAQMEEPPQGP